MSGIIKSFAPGTVAATSLPHSGGTSGSMLPWITRVGTFSAPSRGLRLPEAMIAAGSVLDRPELLQRGLDLLGWLLTRETQRGHLSVAPVGGAGPEDDEPGFDQQPIEVAALADACARALGADGDRRWEDGITSAANWDRPRLP